MSDLQTKILKHLAHLTETIGPRPGGSAANRAAAEYIQNAFREYGLAVEYQPFPCPAWESHETVLKIDGDVLPAAANPYSPSCEVTARIETASTLSELEAADLNGRIAVLFGDLTRQPVAPKSWFLKEERDERIVALLEEKQPAAVLTINPQLGSTVGVFEDAEFTLPSATLPAEAGVDLLRREDPSIYLRIESRRAEGETGNVVGRKPGSSGKRIVLMAHYDTKYDTPGADDNASGVAALLALAEIFAKKETVHALEFVSFANEEYLPIGDDEYVRRNGEDFQDMLAAINFDGAGQRLGADSITAISASPEFQGQVESILSAYPGILWVAPWPQSNHSTFAWRGVPSLAFGSTGAAPINHRPENTLVWVSPQKMADIVQATVEIVESLQDKDLAWTRQIEQESE